MDTPPLSGNFALVVVDVQYDFLPPNGALAVQGGREIIPVVNQLLDPDLNWTTVVASMDYHPKNHISFASTHCLDPFTQIEVQTQKKKVDLWPDHCVQGTKGCEIEYSVKRSLDRLVENDQNVLIIKKAELIDRDEYTAFRDEGVDELNDYLKLFQISNIVLVGLAADYCVKATARAALERGYRVFLVKEGTSAVGGKRSQNEVEKELLNEFGNDLFQSINFADVSRLLTQENN